MNAKDQIIMNDVYRRLHQFHNGDLSTNLLALNFPSEIKPLSKYLVVSDGRETPRVLNWYKLTEEGKKLFAKLPKLNAKQCENIYNGIGYANFDNYIT